MVFFYPIAYASTRLLKICIFQDTNKNISSSKKINENFRNNIGNIISHDRKFKFYKT